MENRVNVSDLHVTILHQLGIDHTLLDYLHMGRAERPTALGVTDAQIVDQLNLPLIYRGETYILAKAGDVRGIISQKGSQKCA